MDDSNKQICRLCLEITPPCECETIKEIRKEILEVLPININLDISDYAVVCNTCLESLHDYSDFKSQCINTFMDADIKVDIKKEVFQSQLVNHEGICQEDPQVCRFCMSCLEVEPLSCIVDWNDEVLLKDVIRNCLPDSNLNAVDESLVCKQCLSSITRYHEFLKSCQAVEQRIEHFYQTRGYGTIGRVNLKDMLTFKNSDVSVNATIIKMECPAVECDDVNVKKSLKSEEPINIKCEEVDIKDELDNGMNDQSEFDQSEEHGNSGTFSKSGIRNIESKGKMHLCPKCPYSTKVKARMKRHMLSHADNKAHRCILCSFVANPTFSLKAHSASHRGSTKVFGCRECPFETDYKHSLKKHLIKHKTNSEVEMHKCLLCPFESKYHSGLWAHQKLKHNNIENISKNDIKMYKCEKCCFSTKYKASLVSHQLLHKNPEEIPKLKCEKCEFQTCYKRYLVKHMLTHEDLEAVDKLKCEKCPYRCKLQRDLLQHMRNQCNKRPFSCDQCTYSSNYKNNVQRHEQLVHQKGGIRPMYKCKLCDYHAKTKSNIEDHMIKTHMDPSKVSTFKCALCPYESTSKHCVSKHKTLHGRYADPSNYKNQQTFKCTLCFYVTNVKENFRRHLFIHQEATLKCGLCDFRTKHKQSLRQHMKLHESVKPPMIKCDKCDYSTRRKDHLKRHTLTHTELGEAVAYRCAMCDFQTKYKRKLKDHIKRCLKKKETNG